MRKDFSLESHRNAMNAMFIQKVWIQDLQNVEQITDYYRTITEKAHICQYCNKKFVMWKFLERHLNTHTAAVIYQCDQCDKKYLNKNHLRVHKFRHAKEPQFKCSICSKAYFDRSTLKKHNYVHIGNPYQCTSCDRTFDRRDKWVHNSFAWDKINF